MTTFVLCLSIYLVTIYGVTDLFVFPPSFETHDDLILFVSTPEKRSQDADFGPSKENTDLLDGGHSYTELPGVLFVK